MQIEKLYEDDDLVIVNKPAGVLVIPDRFGTEGASLNKLLEQSLQQQVWVVHRIDRYTSGAVCFAKSEASHKYLSKLFQDRGIEKYYLGLLNGRPVPEEGMIEKAIIEHPAIKGKMTVAKKGKASITDYKVLEQWPLHSLVQFRIHTGRTHQIRVHMQSIGNSLLCDDLYGDGKPFFLSSVKKKYRLSDNEENERPLISRLALHAWKLEFDKEDGTHVSAEAPLPKDMAATVKQLNKWAGAGL
jgi:23S rRNA pseudouridine1911/1915/1917 synthase